MNQKNNKSKRTFIPQIIGHALRKINRKYTSKFGRLEFLIQSKWTNIAGAYFAEYSEPKNISKILDYKNEYGKNIYKNYLHVNVSPSAALEFQYYKNTIIDKINSHFGYRAIIDIKITQNMHLQTSNNSSTTYKDNKLSNCDKELVQSKVKQMDNDDLKNSLIDLGFNISKVDKND